MNKFILLRVMCMEDFPNKIFTASVLRSEIVAKGVKKITFKVNEPFTFLPWQYVWVEIPDMHISDPHGSRRAFSIFNTINVDNTIEIIARIGDAGYKQNLFALKPGDPVIIHGPFGSTFVIDQAHEPKHVIMIAGGLGIAAFMPMIETVRNKKYSTKCFLVYLNRDEESTPFLKELKSFKKKNDFFDYHVSYQPFAWSSVSQAVEAYGGDIEWWVAGPQGMVDAVYEELEKQGVSRGDMQFENFYPSKKNSLTVDKVMGQMTSDNLFASAIQNSTNHMVIADANGVVLFANKAAERITGYSKSEIVGNTPRLWGGLMSREFYADFWKKKASGKPFQGEIANRRKNGEVYYAIAHIAQLFDESGDIIGFIGTEEDITDRVKLEKAITVKSEELDSFFNTSQDIMGVANTSGYFTRINPAFTQVLGFSMEEITKQPFISLVHPDDIEATLNEVKKLSVGKTTINFVNRYRKKDGGYATLQWNASPQGSNIFATARDITKSKEKEDELEKLNSFMVGRELKMVALKERIAQLEKKSTS